MQKYRLPLIREVPIPSDEEARLPQPIAYYYLASEVDAQVAEAVAVGIEQGIAELELAAKPLYSRRRIEERLIEAETALLNAMMGNTNAVAAYLTKYPDPYSVS